MEEDFMPTGKGKKCPWCHKQTVHQIGADMLKCSNCTYEAQLLDDKSGKGQYCPICRHWTVYNGVCTNNCIRVPYPWP